MRAVSLTLVTIFWLVMMGLLVHRDVVPSVREARRAARGLPYEDIFARTPAEGGTPATVTMDILFAGGRVGDITTTVFPKSDGGYRVRTRISLEASSDVIPLRATVVTQTHIGADNRLISFSADILDAGDDTIGRVSGKVSGDTLHLTIRFRGETETRSMPFNPRYAVADTFSAALRMPNLYVGKRWNIRMLDLRSLLGGRPRFTTGVARVARREAVEWRGRTVTAYVVKMEWDNLTSVAWVDEDGAVLRQKAPGGLTFIRQPSEQQGMENSHD